MNSCIGQPSLSPISLDEIIVDRQQTLRRFIRLDAEAQTALGAIGRLRGAARQQTDSGGGEETALIAS